MFEPLADLAPQQSFAAVLIAEPAMGGAPEEALRLAGGRLQSRLSWAEVPTKLGKHGGRPLILVEVEGVPEAVLVAMLPRIDATATTLDLPVIVALDESVIDVVSAALFGTAVQLLVRPALSERVAALAVAQGSREPLNHDGGVREGEAARLQRLNEEVARIADTLARLTRREGVTPIEALRRGVEDRRGGFDAGPAPDDVETDPGEVRRAIRARRLRDQFFGSGLFEDPAWDMLLDLFAAELEGVQVSVSSLCIAASVAPTTALRWIGKMVDAGLFVREPDPFDRRRAFMTLTPRTSQEMRRYMSASKRAGLAIG
jgi:hypothetical protein